MCHSRHDRLFRVRERKAGGGFSGLQQGSAMDLPLCISVAALLHASLAC